MTAVVKSANEIVAEVQGKSSEPKTGDPKSKEEWTFDFEHKESTGRVRRGTFTNRILSIKDQFQVGVIRAQMCGNAPIDALDVKTWSMAEQVSHMSVSLKKRPKWAADLSELFDPGLVTALYQEVASHEATFHGRGRDSDEGEEAAPDAGGADETTPPGAE